MHIYRHLLTMFHTTPTRGQHIIRLQHYTNLSCTTCVFSNRFQSVYWCERTPSMSAQTHFVTKRKTPGDEPCNRQRISSSDRQRSVIFASIASDDTNPVSQFPIRARAFRGEKHAPHITVDEDVRTHRHCNAMCVAIEVV